jgi:hypothetical protein
MLYAHGRERKRRCSEELLSPLRAGFVYGTVAVVVALVTEFYFLFVDPTDTPAWILAAIVSFRTQLAFAAFLFLGILAALRARPTHIDPDASYKSLLVRDCALAATIVAVMVGVAIFLSTALEATLLAGEVRTFAHDAAPRITEYVEEVRSNLSNPPPPTTVEEVERNLQPPELRDLGSSMGNVAIGAILLGTVGALVGALRGSFGSEQSVGQRAPSAEKQRGSENGKSGEG